MLQNLGIGVPVSNFKSAKSVNCYLPLPWCRKKYILVCGIGAGGIIIEKLIYRLYPVPYGSHLAFLFCTSTGKYST
jgi:hypothetical protein